MDLKLFDKCIKYINNNFNVCLYEDLLQANTFELKEKIATIMFDDGYKDNLNYAAPILQKHDCKASFYIVTNSIDNNTLTWTHIIEYLFQNTNKQTINLDFDFLPEGTNKPYQCKEGFFLRVGATLKK
jgi:peptidoglycan/xylan/chitin deacetylase (PgdA/CDA1 family)